MAIVSSTVLKSYFEVGDKPTEAQYIDLIDTLFDQGVAVGIGEMQTDSLTSGAFVSEVSRLAGTATTLANTGTGEYTFTVQSSAHVVAIDIDGDNTILNGSNELIIKINNSANSQDRRFIVQLLDDNNDALVDQQLTGTAHTQAVSGNITTITLPGMNGFGATGYRVLLR